MLSRARREWAARGRYREMYRHLTVSQRLSWVGYAMRATAMGSKVSRPDEFSFHSAPAFETRHSRPKSPTARGVRLTEPSLPDTAIVMQGPLVRGSDFTFQTAQYYRQRFPESPLVVVAWSTEPLADVERLRSVGAIVVRIGVPDDPGPANINLQRESVSAGLRAARDMGCQFALRTRSDQRFYSDHALTFLHATLEAFRPPHTGSASRIVTTSLDTFRFRLYGLSDQFHFGRVEDLLNFWHPLDVEDDAIHTDNERAVSARRLGLPEVTLTVSFLARTNWTPQWTLGDWWRALADRFVVVDASTLDIYWPKYTSREFRWRRYGPQSPLEELNFADWLSLYAYPDNQLGALHDHLLDLDDWWDPVQ